MCVTIKLLYMNMKLLYVYMYMNMKIYIFKWFSTMVYHRILNIVSYAIQ